MGVDGGYTQVDVEELSRVITGWTLSPTVKMALKLISALTLVNVLGFSRLPSLQPEKV